MIVYTCGECKYFERMKGKDYKFGKCPFKQYNPRGRHESWLTCSEFQPKYGEYIDRQDVLNILIFNWQDRDGDDAMQTSIDAIRVMPATMRADYGKNIADYPSLFECSFCHWKCSDTLSGDIAEYNFCPNCGASMEVDNETD